MFVSDINIDKEHILKRAVKVSDHSFENRIDRLDSLRLADAHRAQQDANRLGVFGPRAEDLVGGLTRRVEGKLHPGIERVFGVLVVSLGKQAWRGVEGCMHKIGTIMLVRPMVKVGGRSTYNFGIAAATLGSPSWA